MSTEELAKTFDPQDIETKWYKTWDEGKYYVDA